MLVILAVSIILVTPNPTDDIDAVLHSQKSLEHISLLPIFAVVLALSYAERSTLNFWVDSSSHSVFRLSSTYRC